MHRPIRCAGKWQSFHILSCIHLRKLLPTRLIEDPKQRHIAGRLLSREKLPSPHSPSAAMRTPEEVYQDFSMRRKGILRALTSEFENFFEYADPNKDNLCLYGLPSGAWEVDLPAEEVPPEMPEPALGINFARDGMTKKDWLALVAVHSDTWLFAVAFYNGARLNRDGRERLFELINEQPTCYEVVMGKGGPPQSKPKKPMMYSDPKPHPSRPSRPGGPPSRHISRDRVDDDEEEGDTDDDEGDNETYADGEGDPCPNCGRVYRVSDFWIQCDYCNTWYDGKCVGMSQAKADRMGAHKWKCPACERRS